MSNHKNRLFFAIVLLFLAGVTEINGGDVIADRRANCNNPGAACLDPRFIGGDGIVFYFHGKTNEHFSLVSDFNLQINAHFIGLRPAGRPRDYTWIQALGILFDTHAFSVEATKAESWDDEVDHLKFYYEGKEIGIPECYPSIWESSESGIKVERTSNKNGAFITLPEIAEISVNVVPITKEDDRIHNYQLPSDDCFAHLDVQFRFYGLSTKVEGVLGRTYQPDFKNPAKPGVAVPVVGGENKYRTSTLLSSKCNSCIFSPAGVVKESDPTRDCSVSPSPWIYQLRENSTSGSILCIIISSRVDPFDHTHTIVKWLKWC